MKIISKIRGRGAGGRAKRRKIRTRGAKFRRAVYCTPQINISTKVNDMSVLYTFTSEVGHKRKDFLTKSGKCVFFPALVQYREQMRTRPSICDTVGAHAPLVTVQSLPLGSCGHLGRSSPSAVLRTSFSGESSIIRSR